MSNLLPPARWALLLLPALAVSGCRERPAGPAAGGGPVTVRFQTDWFPEPEHGGYYQALAKGYYAAEGLNVEILPGGPNAGFLTAVATGRADLGMGNSDDIITAVARGVPVKIVAAEMQHDAQGILFHAEHPVRTVHDLDGKTIMAGPASVWVQLVQLRYGIKFNLRPLAGDLARFMNDPTYLQQCFVTNEPFFAQQRGAHAAAILISKLCPDYDPYRVIFAGTAYLGQHPEVVRRFVRASVKGWVDYLTGDPAPANAVLRKLRPDLPAEFMSYSIAAMRDDGLVLGDAARGEHMGLLTRERLEQEINLLREVGVLDKPVAVDDVATLAFVPPR
ncbi:MAG TPA: ABC transporter substrate-binding protein [Opitutaceae bacterium]|nr:ABC transporter substrate-binding protein [Opitutaceae bacterium]